MAERHRAIATRPTGTARRLATLRDDGMAAPLMAAGRQSAFLTAEWKHLAMLNFEVDPALLHSLVPRGTELDEWGGRVYVSLVGFLFANTRILGLPVPFHRTFEEVNLRFYVR